MKILVDNFPDRAISMEIARSVLFSMFGSVVQDALSDIQLGLNEICCTFTDGVLKSESSSDWSNKPVNLLPAISSNVVLIEIT